MMMSFIRNSNAKYFLFGVLMLIIIGLLLWKFVFISKLSNAEIDQLVMQATFGKDESSLTQLKKAANQGQINAKMAVGKSYLFRHQITSALPFLNDAAQQGNVEAETLLGKLYFHGEAQVKKDDALALKYFSQAFENKDPIAAYYLGLMYKNGYATAVDMNKANRYFEFAAQQNIPSAMFMLGNAYQFGEGEKIDLKQSYEWYKKAADLELPEAIQELVHIYQYGNQAIPADQTEYQQQILEIAHALKHSALTP